VFAGYPVSSSSALAFASTLPKFRKHPMNRCRFLSELHEPLFGADQCPPPNVRLLFSQRRLHVGQRPTGKNNLRMGEVRREQMHAEK
jgi:hypothetical protein